MAVNLDMEKLRIVSNELSNAICDLIVEHSDRIGEDPNFQFNAINAALAKAKAMNDLNVYNCLVMENGHDPEKTMGVIEELDNIFKINKQQEFEYLLERLKASKIKINLNQSGKLNIGLNDAGKEN
jgi:hypothetical protein